MLCGVRDFSSFIMDLTVDQEQVELAKVLRICELHPGRIPACKSVESDVLEETEVVDVEADLYGQ